MEDTTPGTVGADTVTTESTTTGDDDVIVWPHFGNSTSLNYLPYVTSLFGIDLPCGAFVVAALGAVHIFFYGCTFFMNLSYLLVTVWVLVVLYSVFSFILIYGLLYDDLIIMIIWTWYALVFVGLMFILLLLFAIVVYLRAQYKRLMFVLIGILWYVLTIYFILVVNSYRFDKAHTS